MAAVFKPQYPLARHSTPLVVRHHNPTAVTVEREAYGRSYISLPWTHDWLTPLTLGVGFSTAAANTESLNPFKTTESAFDSDAMQKAKIDFHRFDSCNGKYVSNVTTTVNGASEHLSLALGVGIGNKYAGASVSGSFDKSAIRNMNSFRASRRASFEAGALHLSHPPPLSKAARDLLDSAGYTAFAKRYGDFYITSLVLGGDAGVMYSDTSTFDATADYEKITGEAHLLIFSDEETFVDKREAFENRSVQIALTAFDSLDGSFVDLPVSSNGSSTSSASLQEVRTLAVEYDKRVQNLAARVRASLAQMPVLNSGLKHVEWDHIHVLATSGLMTRIVMVPFAQHREVRPSAFEASE